MRLWSEEIPFQFENLQEWKPGVVCMKKASSIPTREKTPADAST
jgi:hypothetical protein